MSGRQINSGYDDASNIPPSYDQAHSMDPLEQGDDPAGGDQTRHDTIMCIFKRGWASGAQIDAETNLIKAEALLTEMFPNINNLNRLQQGLDKENQPDDQTDKQSIFSRLSRSSKMSRKVSSSCSRQRLKMMIAADRISISSFLGQARACIKHQKGFVSRASRSSVTVEEAERWLSEEIAGAYDKPLKWVVARQVYYLPEPRKKGYTLLCQTKRYRNTLREQERRMLFIDKTISSLK